MTEILRKNVRTVIEGEHRLEMVEAQSYQLEREAQVFQGRARSLGPGSGPNSDSVLDPVPDPVPDPDEETLLREQLSSLEHRERSRNTCWITLFVVMNVTNLLLCIILSQGDIEGSPPRILTAFYIASISYGLDIAVCLFFGPCLLTFRETLRAILWIIATYVGLVTLALFAIFCGITVTAGLGRESSWDNDFYYGFLFLLGVAGVPLTILGLAWCCRRPGPHTWRFTDLCSGSAS